ncbi:MAG: LysR family transcriptional regulator [Oscillospiraceae bacterium]|nr:LysR family transcriptional regulator [Oscillospiraceae bacterium]
MSASFDSYKIFYFVGKYKNITHAAGALFLSQSTVSRAIQSLEADLGCKLMERSQQGIFLTAEGEMLFRHVARAYEEIILGEDRIKRLKSFKTVSVRIGSDNFVFCRFILPVLKEFQKDYPDVRVEISSVMTDSPAHITSALINDETDAVFSLSPLPDSENIVSSALFDYSDAFIAGKNHRSLMGENIRIYDISIENFISLNHGISGREYLQKFFSMHNLRVESSYQVEDLRHLFDMVNSGMGIALVPAPLADTMKAYDNIFTVRTNLHFPKRTICVSTAKNAPQNPARDELIKRINRQMQNAII